MGLNKLKAAQENLFTSTGSGSGSKQSRGRSLGQLDSREVAVCWRGARRLFVSQKQRRGALVPHLPTSGPTRRNRS
jgi:hypothetical protein